ncbi:MAG: hypothetical protein CMH58_09165 [Myxococcales bacterium]|nr:hypothetical protein [Myxococcales bacterium]
MSDSPRERFHSDDTVSWVAARLMEGHLPADIVITLARHDPSLKDPEDTVIQVLESPIFRVAFPKIRAARRLALAASLQRRVRLSGRGSVERRKGLTAAALYDNYVHAHRPVVISGFAEGWPALAWRHQSLAQRFGDEPIEVLDNRLQADHPDRDFKALKTKIKPSDFAKRVEEELGNNLYLVANNHLMAQQRSKSLTEDFCFPEGFLDLENHQGCNSLWWGPAGTKTAAHHDTCHALFLQLRGRKQFHFASPLDPRLMMNLDGYYQGHRDLHSLTDQILETTLMPGDLLLIPVGWWHQVEALDASIGMSFTNLLVPNRFDDYRPGFL